MGQTRSNGQSTRAEAALPPAEPRGFTLVELLVTVTLMGVAVGLAVFRLDGLTETGRLRATAAQIASVVHLAQQTARTTGEPRLVAIETDRIRVQRPVQENGRWTWGEAGTYATANGVRVEEVLTAGLHQPNTTDCIRIRPDGRHPGHAVVLVLHDVYMVLALDGIGGMRSAMPSQRPTATTYELLLAELEAAP